MNDGVADNENAALTQEEALQVLRLSPDGLRRLADLDEAISELKAARRSLLANRLETLRDAFAVARNGRDEEKGGAERPIEQIPNPEATETRSPGRGNGSGESGGDAPPRAQVPKVTVERTVSHDSELRMLRTEVAELRREVAAMKGQGAAPDAELQQVLRRLSYLEAELESRQL